VIRSVDTTFPLWAALGGAAAFELGIALEEPPGLAWNVVGISPELQRAKAAGQAE
jgi:hypothetical protein